MIKRHYFMSVEKPHNDGSGSYSFDCCTASKKSWFPDSEEMFEYMKSFFKEKMKDKKGDNLRIVSFSRI